MRCFTSIITLILLATHVLAQQAAADTRYVTDQLIIMLRSGKSSEYKIIKSLKTGAPLEVLEEDESYLKVRTKDGTEGYVLRQYVTANPPKTQQINELALRNTALEKKVRDLAEARENLDKQLRTLQENYDEEMAALAARSTSLENDLEAARNQEHTVTEKYDALLAQSQNVVEISEEHDRLVQQNKKLQEDFTALAEKNEKLADSRMIKWFLAGGGVFLFGWIVGKISRKKRSRF